MAVGATPCFQYDPKISWLINGRSPSEKGFRLNLWVGNYFLSCSSAQCAMKEESPTKQKVALYVEVLVLHVVFLRVLDGALGIPSSLTMCAYADSQKTIPILLGI